MNVLGLFVKHPVPGRVKTRLAGCLGEQNAAELYAAFVADLVERFQHAADARCLCYAPPEAEARHYFGGVAGDRFSLWPQPELDLGGRMRAFFDHAFSSGAEKVVVIGSDSPTLPAAYVEQAFEQLDECACVFGPATDGGYYLVGQRDQSRPLFDGVDWSSPRVLEQTVARVERLELTMALLPAWYDVDTPADLLVLSGHVRALQRAGSGDRPPRTAELLAGDIAKRLASL